MAVEGLFLCSVTIPPALRATSLYTREALCGGRQTAPYGVYTVPANPVGVGALDDPPVRNLFMAPPDGGAVAERRLRER